jgi:hypothetical protein
MTILIMNLSQIMKRDDYFNQEPFTDYEGGMINLNFCLKMKK